MNKSYSLIKKDINQLPLSELGRQFLALRDLAFKKHIISEKARDPSLDPAAIAGSFRGLGSAEMLELDVLLNRFTDTYQIPKNAPWFFPQCLARLAQIKPPRNEQGKVSAARLLKEHYSKDNFIMGIYTLFVFAKRGTLLKNQTSEVSRNFCKLVPLIMSAYKQYSNINYEDWVATEVDLVVDADLYEAMCAHPDIGHEEHTWYITALYHGYLPENGVWDDIPHTEYDGEDLGGFPAEDILAWRNDALTVKTGEKKGVIRSPVSTYSLSPSEDNPMKELDPLTRHMFMQTWCAHPDNRTPLMILDPLYWDHMPDPIIDIRFLHPSIEEEAQMLFNAMDTPEKEKYKELAPW